MGNSSSSRLSSKRPERTRSSPAATSALSSPPDQPNPQSRRASQPCPSERPHKTARNDRPSLQPVPFRPGRASKRISNNFDAASPHDVHHFYDVDAHELGTGKFGVVRKVTRKLPGMMQDGTAVEAGAVFALKSILKSKVVDKASLEAEVSIMRRIKHRNIIQLHEVYEDALRLHLVMELCTGGELFDRIISLGHYTEPDARALFRSMLEAVAYMHSQGVAHRDLKPDNFLLASEATDAELKVIDFGLSKVVGTGESGTMHARVGTAYYIAPEVLKGEYDVKCDVWSLGVILYILLCGYPPFHGDNNRQIFERVRVANYNFDSPEWHSVSDLAKDMIKRVFVLDVSKRPSAAELLEHDWLADEQVERGMETDEAPPAYRSVSAVPVDLAQTMRRLRRFQRQNQLQKMAMKIIATQLTQDEIGGLRAQFQKIDTDRSGTLSASELQDAMSAMGYHGVVEALFDSLDADGDEQINFDEFVLAAMQRNTIMRDQRLAVAFNQFDTDGDGTISMKELVVAMGSEEHAREVMRDVDTNQDGVISKDEFKAMMSKIGSGVGTEGSSLISFASLVSSSSFASSSSRQLSSAMMSISETAPAPPAVMGADGPGGSVAATTAART